MPGRHAAISDLLAPGGADHHNVVQAVSRQRLVQARWFNCCKWLSESDSATVKYETRAKKLLKGELKRRGITYARLAEMLAAIGGVENERNLNNKISRGGFTAALFLQCLNVIETKDLRL